MSTIKKILIGSCGGLTGSYLARQFKKLGLITCGADASYNNVTKFFVDEFFLLPSAKEDVFKENLLMVLKENNIDAYVPTHSVEIRVIADNEEFIRKNWRGHFLVSPAKSFEMLDNKKEANRNLKLVGIPVPKLLDDKHYDGEYPIFMKNNVGSGSSKAMMIETPGLYREYGDINAGKSFFEYIKGTEYTVDCMFDDKGRLIAFNQRIRRKNMGGAVIITQNDYSFDIEPYLRIIEKKFVIKGCVNFQYILRDGVPYFTDINLRYASGGLPLTVASGIDVPQIMINLWEGKKIEHVVSCNAPGKIMYRYFEEKFDG